MCNVTAEVMAGWMMSCSLGRYGVCNVNAEVIAEVDDVVLSLQ